MADPQAPGYEIQRPLGSGGMAEVFLARQEGLDRLVALKFLSLDKQPDIDVGQFKERFYREARLVGGLDHAGITPVYQFGETDEGQLWLSMQYLGGGDLADLLRGGGIGEERSLEIFRTVASALEHAHKAGIVHRDIKPENILFDDAGHAKVADFGIARNRDEQSSLTTGFVLGTLAYMSPEQMLSTEDVDAGADLYALGAVFFEMLTGSRAFPQNTPEAVYIAKTTGELTLPDVFSRYQPILNRLLAKEPGDRFASAGELLEAIDALIHPAAPAPQRPMAAYALVLAAVIGASVWGAVQLLKPSAYSLGDQLDLQPDSATVYLLPDLQALDRRTQLESGSYQALAWAPAHRMAQFSFDLPMDDTVALTLRALENPSVEEFHGYMDLVANPDEDGGALQAYAAQHPQSPLLPLARASRGEADLAAFERGAQVGDAVLQIAYSEALELGWSELEVNWSRSMSLARSAADTGYAFGQFHYALQLLEEGARNQLALELLQKSADQGFFAAENLLGRVLVSDDWGPAVTDVPRGAELLQRAADQGYREAIFTLGTLYFAGLGVPRDAEKARALYEQAAALGYEPARDYLKG